MKSRQSSFFSQPEDDHSLIEALIRRDSVFGTSQHGDADTRT
jgi:hypothetical protein